MQERRIAMLEKKLINQEGTQNPSQYEDVVSDEPEIKEEIMFRGKGFKSQFNGATSIMSMISMVHTTSPDPDTHVPKTDHRQVSRAAGFYARGSDR
jgi:hypothetical protein